MSALSDPAYDLVPLTPDDDTDITGCRSLLIEESGDLVFRTRGNPTTTRTLAVSAGDVINVLPTRVMTATTATVWGYFG